MFNFNTKPFHVACAGAYVKQLLLWQQAADNKPNMNQYSQGIGLCQELYHINTDLLLLYHPIQKLVDKRE